MNLEGDEDNSASAKVVLLGESNVGKTCTVVRYVHNFYDGNNANTIVASYFTKELKVGKCLLRLHIWDTAGQERFRSLAPMYYRDAHGVLIFYDITDRSTFDKKIDEWVGVVMSEAVEKVNLVIVGNKVDNESAREVSTEEGRACAERLGLPFFEVSAKEGICIDEMFAELANSIVENNWDTLEKTKGDGGGKSDQGTCDLNVDKTSGSSCC